MAKGIAEIRLPQAGGGWQHTEVPFDTDDLEPHTATATYMPPGEPARIIRLTVDVDEYDPDE